MSKLKNLREAMERVWHGYDSNMEALERFYFESDEPDQRVMDAYPEEIINANYEYDEDEDGDWNDYLSDKVIELAKRYKEEIGDIMSRTMNDALREAFRYGYDSGLEDLADYYSLSDKPDQVIMDAYADEMIEAQYAYDEDEDGDWHEYMDRKVDELEKRYNEERNERNDA